MSSLGDKTVALATSTHHFSSPNLQFNVRKYKAQNTSSELYSKSYNIDKSPIILKNISTFRVSSADSNGFPNKNEYYPTKSISHSWNLNESGVKNLSLLPAIRDSLGSGFYEPFTYIYAKNVLTLNDKTTHEVSNKTTKIRQRRSLAQAPPAPQFVYQQTSSGMAVLDVASTLQFPSTTMTPKLMTIFPLIKSPTMLPPIIFTNTNGIV